MNPTTPRFVALGMYAFTETQQSCWQQLFTRFCELSSVADDSVMLSFDHDPVRLLESGLWFGHTCGYPLVTQLKDYVSPFCVPLFDVPGTDERFYSSHFVVGADSNIDSVEANRGRVAVMNNPDSNSGMNVFRHAVAEVSDSDQFFASVITSGGHLHSLEMVANRSADIASIDCVSYQLIADCRPELCAEIRIIGDSVKTCGLPLVMTHADMAVADTETMIKRLNQALALCDGVVRDTLHLSGFASVQLDDYRRIVEIEQYAIQRGYPQLN
jgi:ABC-type phosphate/phosphonate transport system substrate-binding protein